MKKVAIIDSGSGGINVLRTLMAECKGFQFLYLADTEFAPYGEKTKKDLVKRAEKLVLFLKQIFNPEIIIFACNTLTAVAIKEMRKAFPEIEFIGCEPAVKPDCEEFDQEKVLILATPVTLNRSELIKRYPFVKKKSIKNLPKLIDENLFELEKLDETLLRELKDLKISAVVLGCTHFEAIRKQIENITGAKIFGSSEGIAKRLSHFSDGTNEVCCSFMTTGKNEDLIKFYYFLIKNEEF